MIYYLFLSGYTKHCSLSQALLFSRQNVDRKSYYTYINLAIYLPKHIKYFLDISVKQKKNNHNDNEIKHNVTYIYIHTYMYTYIHT